MSLPITAKISKTEQQSSILHPYTPGKGGQETGRSFWFYLLFVPGQASIARRNMAQVLTK